MTTSDRTSATSQKAGSAGTAGAPTQHTNRPDDRSTRRSGQPDRSRTRRTRRRWRRVWIGLAVVVALIVGTAAGYLVFLERTVSHNVRHAPLLPAGTEAQKGNQANSTGSDTGAVPVMNVLLIGSDERDEQRARSDVIILAHLDAARQRVYLVHFPRDLYVPIPGRPGRDRINAAYRYGGVPLLAETIGSLTGVRLDHAAQLDFERFTAMTDAVGGVEVTVEEASPGFPKGRMHMNGTQALQFVRERMTLSEGDISRGRREQAFVRALLLKALSRETLTNPVRFADFVDATTEHLTVDEQFDVAEMRTEAIKLRGLRSSDVVFLTAPLGRHFTTSGGAMVIDPDRAGLKRLGAALMQDGMSGYRG